MKRRTWLAQAVCTGLAGGRAGWVQAAARVRVAAASDLKFVLGELLPAFERETGIVVEASFGSSGNFARQIRQGLPVHLYLSADEVWVQQLVEAGLTRVLPGGVRDAGAIYGLGRIALIVPAASTLTLDVELRGLRAGWDSVRKFAIANPEHAPYGRAAQQALEQLGLWELVHPRLVLGENIAQATQFVTSGAAQAGITALSLALAPALAGLGRHLALPATAHQPLRQRMVLLRESPAEAERLYAYLQTAAAQAVFRRYGFQV